MLLDNMCCASSRGLLFGDLIFVSLIQSYQFCFKWFSSRFKDVGLVQCYVVLLPQPLKSRYKNGDQLLINVFVDVHYIILSKHNVLGVGYVILWVTFIGVDVIHRYDLLQGRDVSSVFNWPWLKLVRHLLLEDLCVGVKQLQLEDISRSQATPN